MLEEIFESAYWFSIGVILSVIKEDKNRKQNIELMNDIERFENDTNILEKLSMFPEVFKMKNS